MYSFCVEEQKGLAYHFEGLRVPLVQGSGTFLAKGAMKPTYF